MISLAEEMVSEILKESLEIPEVERAEFTEYNTKILVLTQEEQYPVVMTRIVNIFSRIGHGCELSFAGFTH